MHRALHLKNSCPWKAVSKQWHVICEEITYLYELSELQDNCPGPPELSGPGPIYLITCHFKFLGTISRSLLSIKSIESVMLCNHLILCCPFSFCLQSFLASGSFPVSQLLTSAGQSIEASSSVLPMNIQC